MRPRYYCKKYCKYLTKRDIMVTHKGRCFRMRKGHRKGKRCSMLVEV